MEIEKIQQEIVHIKNQLLNVDGVAPATLVEVYRKINDQKFGPYKIAVFMDGGKKHSKYLNELKEKLIKNKILNYKKAKRLFSRWVELEMQLTQIEMDMLENKTDLKTINSNRKIELRKDKGYIHIMKYMGSKRELLPDIKDQVAKLIPKGATVLDLFAGTASVGAYLRNDYNIVSNDIQEYSKVLANALVGASGKRLKHSYKETISKLEEDYNKNRQALIEMLPKTLKKSDKFVSLHESSWDEETRESYLEFFGSFPCPENEFQSKNKELKHLKEEYFLRNQENGKFPYLQTTFLFSETYFSVQQAIDIDSLRFAINNQFDDEVSHSLAMSALMYAHSYCSSGTGHFAMFRDIKSVSSAKDVFKYRGKNVFEFFKKKYEELLDYASDYNGNNHESWSLDFRDALADENLVDIDLLYADPPYSFVHYSRFYHATESLVRYDYNIPEHKGRYRTDRHQSPFCQKKNVEDAFRYMIEACSRNKVAMLLSYSDTGMIKMDDIIKILKDNNFKVVVKDINYDHSTMGRSGHKSNAIKEYLISAKVKEAH